MVGYLSSRSLSDSQDIIAAFHQGLSEAGFVDKQNVLIEYRFAEFNFDRLSGLAAELVRRQINVLVATGGTVSAVKAKLVLPTTAPSTCAAEVEAIRAAWAGRPDGYAKAATPVTSAQV